MAEARGRGALFLERQAAHLAAVLVLLACLVPAWRHPLMDRGALWRFTSREIFAASIINAIAHQTWVWLWWRAELHYSLPSRVLGKYAFEIYATPFFLMLGMRPMLAFMLAYSNMGTLAIPAAVSSLVPAIMLASFVYLGYSIQRYFGFTRAAGADHFYEKYRKKPLVDKGIFRFTGNSMYVFGFLILWIPAVYWASFAAFFSAFFSHIYIWVHFYCTERPDMGRIYTEV